MRPRCGCQNNHATLVHFAAGQITLKVIVHDSKSLRLSSDQRIYTFAGWGHPLWGVQTSESEQTFTALRSQMLSTEYRVLEYGPTRPGAPFNVYGSAIGRSEGR